MTPILAAGLLSPNIGLAVWILITFGLLWLLLWRFAWGPITSALEERENTIQSSIDQAERALAEARQIQADNDKARREAEADAQKILREARDTAETLRTEEVEKTKAQIRHMQESAQTEIERERDAALQTLRNEVADLAISAAGRVLGESVDDARQRKLVDNFLNDLPTN
ncbi:MAG: F0F1 ATP synthase subunit B [Rhodothermales bacterium]|nr:F0F1 ATP synthase subunit B [Rhodothermales bacterium]MBO6778332.1 F0F1 ATP synthase subunit B [Rhodothermales bacterium]